MDKSNLIFLDTETTGLGQEDRLCQVAYKFQGNEAEGIFKPEVPISVEAMSISHITNKMVADKKSFSGSEMFRDLEKIFADQNILVAHNAGFDAEMLKREGLEPKQMIDTFKIAAHLDETGEIPKYNLQYLRYYFDFEIENAPAHDAMGDVRVLEVLFDFYFDKMKEKIDDERKIIEEMVKISELPVLIKKFNFGKYNGRIIAEVAQEDEGYLKWLLGEKIKEQDGGVRDNSDWIFTLSKYLNEGKATLF